MKSPYNFIVKPLYKKRYNNTKDIGEVEFITSVSQEDHTSSNRFAEVIETPINYKGPVQVGDMLLVHHNVFKFYYDMYGRQKSGRSYFKDDLFFVDESQFYMYKRNGKWSAYGKYCFVEPVEVKDFFIHKGVKSEPLVGKVKYINQELLDMGVKEGDEVSFRPDSEYEFIVEDEVMYRMYTQNITMVL